MRQAKKGRSLREGFEYQDYVAALFLLDMITPGCDVLRVWVESETGVHVDDIQVERLTGMEFYQVKCAMRRSAAYSFADLLEKRTERSRSILQKFATSWEDLKALDKPVTLRLYSNRIPSGEENDLEDALDGARLKRTFITGRRFKAVRNQWLEQTGFSNQDLEQFVDALRFDLKQRELEDLEMEVQKQLRSLGISVDKDTLLLGQCQKWARERIDPIESEHVRRLLGLPEAWGDVLSQEFPVKEAHFVLLRDLQEQLESLITTVDGGYIVLTGKPGSGKSTFLQHYANYRRSEFGERIVKYFCFVRISDPRAPERISADAFIRSMIHQLHEEFPEVFQAYRYYERSTKKFIEMLQLLGQRAAEGEVGKVVMIVDGLDHVERLGKEGTAQLLSEVLPHAVPRGIVFIISAQAERYLPSFVLGYGTTTKLTLTGFDLEETTEYLLQRRKVAEVLEQRVGSTLTELQIEQIHRKTGGLPLYLRYIAEDLLRALPKDIDAFLERQPSIRDGDIDKYHQYIWDEVAADYKTRYLLTALALMRFRAPHTFLFEVVRGQIDSIELSDKLGAISHVLDIDRRQRTYWIFHDAFKQFVLQRVKESYPDWVSELTGSIFNSLRNDDRNSLTLAHLFYYARASGEHDFVLDNANLDFVNRCIEAARPFPEIQDNLKTAIDVAVTKQDLVGLAKLGLLASYTAQRFEYDVLDRVRLLTTLLEMGRVDDVLESVSYNYRLYGNPNDLLDLVAALPRYGAEETGWRLFEQLRKEMSALSAASRSISHEPQLTKYVGALAAYRYEPLGVIEWIYGIRWQSDTEQRQAGLLRSYIRSLGEYGDRDFLALIREQSSDEAIRSLAAREEIEVLVAEGQLATAQEVLKQVFPLSVIPEEGDLHLAALAARCAVPVEEVKRYLRRTQAMPDLARERIHHPEVLEELRKFRQFVFVLSYCKAVEELDFIRTELNRHQTWYAICFRTAFDLAVAEGKRASKGECDYAAALLESLSRIATFQSYGDGTPVWSQRYYFSGPVVWLCSEISTLFVEMFPDKGQELSDRVAALYESEVLSWDGYLSILELLAAKQPCRPSIRLLLPEVAQQIGASVLDGSSRSRAYVHLAGIAGRCQDNYRAEEWLRLGIQASHCHGYHEDPVLDGLTASMSAMNALDPAGALERCTQVGELLRWLNVVTDMDDISFIPLDFFEEVSRVNLEAGFHLLDAIRRDWGIHLYNSCIGMLAAALAPSDPVVAWEMAETLTEIGSDGHDLIEDVNYKIRIVREACMVSHDAAAELAQRARLAILTELPPNLRAGAVEVYNVLARDYPGLAPAIPSDRVEGDDRSSEDNILDRVRDIRIEIDGRQVDLDRLAELASLSWEDFQRVAREAVAAEETRYYVIPRLGEILLDHFIPRASSQATLETIGQLAEETGIGDSYLTDGSVFAALADRSKELGLTSLFICYVLKHLEHTHFWSPYWYGPQREEEINQLFLALAAHDRSRANQFLYESLRKVFGEQAHGAPQAVGKLCQLLPELDQADQVPPIYDGFLSFCQTFFASLPPLDEQYTWLGDFQPAEARPGSLVTRFLLQRLAWPEYKVRERAVVSLFRLSQTHTDDCLPAVIQSLDSPDYSIRVGAMAVVAALATHVPNVVRTWISSIKALLGSKHLVLVDMAEHALWRLDAAERDLRVGEWSEGTRRLIVSRQWTTLHLPVGAGREARELIDSIPAARTDVDFIARVLDVEEQLVTTKVGLELTGGRYTEQEVNEQDREIYHTFYDVVEERFASPVELRRYYMLRHAIIRVAQDLVEQLRPERWTVELLRSHFRSFDPALPNLQVVPKPREVELNFGTDVDTWIAFADVQKEISQASIDGEWAVIFESTHATRDRQVLDVLRFVCLVDPDVTGEGCQTVLNSTDYPLRMLTPQDYGELPIHAAQQFASLSPWPFLDPTGFHPMLALHMGNWELCGGPYCLVTLVRPLISKYGLDWCDRASLNLHRKDDEVVRVITWRDGYRTTGRNIFWPTSHGTLLRVRTDFLEEVAVTEAKQLFEISVLTRKVKKERYRLDDQDRSNAMSTGRLLRIRND